MCLFCSVNVFFQQIKILRVKKCMTPSEYMYSVFLFAYRKCMPFRFLKYSKVLCNLSVFLELIRVCRGGSEGGCWGEMTQGGVTPPPPPRILSPPSP